MTNLNIRKFRFTTIIIKTLPPHHPDSKSTSSEYSDTEGKWPYADRHLIKLCSLQSN